MLAAAPTTVQRHAIRVGGAVQGVGFRPFVYRLALELQLTGWVFNDAQGVAIEAQGSAQAMAHFLRRLKQDAPPLARVESLQDTPRPALDGDAGFQILASRAGPVSTGIPPDTATCPECLAELRDPANRRHRYALINCTQCGPRYTITRALPYDRAQTSMAGFAQCPACLAEYTDPLDRRFHAEPNACPVCGPQLRLLDAQGQPIEGDPITQTLRLLLAGRIVAVKGLGGFHLACDAQNAAAVATLRQRKQREEKPFAVMAGDLRAALQWVQADAAAQRQLQAAERPIVLLPMLQDSAARLVGVTPGLHVLGMMLPGTPIQALLFDEAPMPQQLLLVMTSANPGGEPLVVANDEALARLAGIADAVLLHDRDIVARCDDSVLRMSAGMPQFIRRARGYTPRPIRLARSGPPVLALGAWLKNTVCITRGAEAFLSPHIGDLDNAATCKALEEAVQHLGTVLDVTPQLVAHDLHPDFFSTRLALRLAAEHGWPTIAVQHHHAHVAAVAAEHGVDEPLLGLALDGVGLGTDGQAWGGELLQMDGAHFDRLGHVAPLALPGGDVAAREPWRMAAAALHQVGLADQIEPRFGHRPTAQALRQMLERGLRCPPTTSMGRWFDAAAALLQVRETSAYEGQAPMLLEALAAAATPGSEDLTGLVQVQASGELDPGALITRLAHEDNAAHGAWLFHQALADGLVRWVAHAAQRTGLRTVALGGGCFLNALLCGLLVPQLQAQGLRVLQARQAPPNDGGIALGQAWVARLSTLSGD